MTAREDGYETSTDWQHVARGVFMPATGRSVEPVQRKCQSV
jgi:hypothetical protein